MPGQTTNQGTRHTWLAGAAITANQAVKASSWSNGRLTVIPTAAITDDVIGVAQETVANGEDVLCEAGNGVIVKCISKTGVTAGQQVMPDGGGAGKVATAAGATAKSFGIAMSTSAADGELVEVLTRFGVNGPLNA